VKVLFVVRDLEAEHPGIMLLSSILKKANHSADIVEANYNKIIRKLRKDNFPILAFSSVSTFIRDYLNLNHKIKERFNVLSFFGGPHPTYFPEVINEPGVDGVCIGEGDFALLDLVNNLAVGKPITGISNWWIKQDGEIFYNSPRPLVEDLDSLPFADRTLFPCFDIVTMVTTRGCFYSCSFCLQKSPFRYRSVENVIEELKKIKTDKYARFVVFRDSIFNLFPEWLKKFSEKYRKEVGLPFWCNVRADLITPEVTRYLKEAGCFSVSLGLETANDYLRNEVLKKGISRDQITCAVDTIKKYKIRLVINNMIGIPFGSLKDDLDTLKLNIQYRPDYGRAYMTTIFKNTDLCNFVIKDYKVLQRPYKYACLDSYAFIPTARKIKNLYKLFSIVVEFPFLFPILQFLIKLPLRWIYALFYYTWLGYCQYYRIWAGSSLGSKKYTKGLKQYFKLLQRYFRNI